MTTEKLQKANELSKLIKEYESALLCFEYDVNEFVNYHREQTNEELLPSKMVSTNPKLIIEYDEHDDGVYRHTQPIPMVLSDFLVDMIKKQIKENLERIKEEFKNL